MTGERKAKGRAAGRVGSVIDHRVNQQWAHAHKRSKRAENRVKRSYRVEGVRQAGWRRNLTNLVLLSLSMLPAEPALIVAEFDGAAGLLEETSSQTVVDEYVERRVRSATAPQKISSIAGADLPDR